MVLNWKIIRIFLSTFAVEFLPSPCILYDSGRQLGHTKQTAIPIWRLSPVIDMLSRVQDGRDSPRD
jgi:hypothetical protein